MARRWTLMISTVQVPVAHLFAGRTASPTALLLARMTATVTGFCTLEVTCERLAAWNLQIIIIKGFWWEIYLLKSMGGENEEIAFFG